VVRCRDVAALITAALLRRNPTAVALPFNDRLHSVALNPRDSVLTNAERLASLPNGGTNCSLPLAWLNAQRRHADLVVYVSDNESWIDSLGRARVPWARPTETMREWEALKARCPGAKLVCIDLTPYGTVQAPERADILNIGGFSDAVFDVLRTFAEGGLDADHWVGVIESIKL
jgi:60 kDa SS-A/Ro ribonucleoprotein